MKIFEITNTQSVENAKNLLGNFRFYFNKLVESKNVEDISIVPNNILKNYKWLSLKESELQLLYTQFCNAQKMNDISYISKKDKHVYTLDYETRWSVKNHIVSFSDFDIEHRISKHSRIAKVELYCNNGKYYIAIETVKNKRPRKEKVVDELEVARVKNNAASVSKDDSILCVEGFRFVREKQAHAENLIRKYNKSVSGSNRRERIFSRLMKLQDETFEPIVADKKLKCSKTFVHRYQIERAKRREKRNKAFISLPIEEQMSKAQKSETKFQYRIGKRVAEREKIVALNKFASDFRELRLKNSIEKKLRKKQNLLEGEFSIYFNIMRKHSICVGYENLYLS